MPTTSSPPPRSAAPAGAGDRAGRDGQADVPGHSARPPVESAEILKGGKALDILHNGCLYRLQVTRLGKLILTK